MSESEETITSETALIIERMTELDPAEPRYHALKAAVNYKASWIDLAERLNVVAENREYKQWGFGTFKDYCRDELQLAQTVARKLVRGFQWLDREAPRLLEQLEGQTVPDMETVDVLVRAEREVERDRLSQQDYDEIKGRALRGDVPARELRGELNAAVLPPETTPTEARLKLLRRTLTSAEKIAANLEEAFSDDPEIQKLAADLRDAIFERVSGLLDEAVLGAEAPARPAGKEPEPFALSAQGGDSIEAPRRGEARREAKARSESAAEAPAPRGAKNARVTVIVGERPEQAGRPKKK